MKPLCSAILLAAPIAANAFFDDFDGSALEPHWFFYSEGSNMVYDVGGGALNVTGVQGPFEFDQAYIYTHVGPHGDFTATTRFAWDSGAHQQFHFGLSEDFPFAPRLAVMSYVKSPGASASIGAFLEGGGSASVPAPAAGFHEFSLARVGTTITARLDGSIVHQTATGTDMPFARIFLEFSGPEGPNFGTFNVDWVNAVPEPGSVVALSMGLCVLIRRKRARALSAKNGQLRP